VRNHIYLSAARQAPEGILRALRSIDDLYDIHYLGDGRWAVGRVVKTDERRTISVSMKHNIMRNPHMKGMNRRLALAKLGMEGFGVVAVYKFLGEPNSQLVEDIRKRDYLYRVQREKEFREFLDKADAHDKLPDNVYDEIEARERHVAPQLFRNAKSFTRGASNGEM